MMNYIKKRASEIDLTLLRYVGAFGDGLRNARCSSYSPENICPKIRRAYEDGIRMKKKELTQSKVADRIREH